MVDGIQRTWSVFSLTNIAGYPEILIPALAFIGLVVLSALFSATETAFSSLNEIRVKQLTKTSHGRKLKQAKRVSKLMKDYGAILSTVLVGNNLVNLSASALVTYLFSVSLQLGEQGVFIATLVVSVVIIILGEIFPKNLAQVYATRFALFISLPFSWFVFILRPITFWFSKIHSRIEDSVEDEDEKVTATEEELLEIVETIEKEGVLEQTESEIIQSAIKFDDIEVEKIMVPKEQTTYLFDDDNFQKVVETFTIKKYSRIPVVHRASEQVIGILRQQAVFDALARQKAPIVTELMSVPVFISQKRLLPYALEKMQQQKAHMAIVVDNLRNRTFIGILTLEDILEEIVGEIYDEYDELPTDIVEIGHHIFEVSGHVELEELFDRHLDETNFPKTTHVTLGPWVKSISNSNLKPGDELKYDNLLIKVLDVNLNQIKRVEIHQYTKHDEEE